MNIGIEVTTLGPDRRLFAGAYFSKGDVDRLNLSERTPAGIAEEAVEGAKTKCTRGCGNCALRASQFSNSEPGAVSIEIDCPDLSCPAENGDPLVIMASDSLVDEVNRAGVETKHIDDTSTQIGQAVVETYK